MVKKKGISQRIENAQLLINGALGQPAVSQELAQTQAMIEAMSSAKQHYKSLIGEAQMATQQRNAALKDLDVWVRKFTKVARIALEEQDQLLEGMGLLVRSKG